MPTETLLLQAANSKEPVSSADEQSATKLPPTNGIHTLINPSNYSSYTKLLDITAYVLRFVHNTTQKHFKLTGPLTSSEL